MLRHTIHFLSLLLLLTTAVECTEAFAQAADSARAGAVDPPIDLYVDCTGSYCDADYLRREIAYVDHVRDRLAANVHLVISTRRTGSGGTEFTLTFQGRGAFEQLTDTLSVFAQHEETYEQVRDHLVRAIEAGLMRYVGRTDLYRRIRIQYFEPVTATGFSTDLQREDPWRQWVFRLALDASADGEEQYRSLNVSGTLAANHTTDEWKVRLTAQSSRLDQRFEVDGEGTYTDIRNSYRFDGLAVRSVGDHWSVGALSSLNHSTYSNIDQAFEGGFGVEANVFPYGESSRREFTFFYEAGVGHTDYQQETIYGKRAEWMGRQALDVYLSVLQPWGSASMSVAAYHLLPAGADPNFDTYRLTTDVNLAVQLGRGLAFYISAGASLVRDQRQLPRGQATPEEIFLRRQELATDYRYYTTAGLSYTFGSIYSNVVNPRFTR